HRGPLALVDRQLPSARLFPAASAPPRPARLRGLPRAPPDGKGSPREPPRGPRHRSLHRGGKFRLGRAAMTRRLTLVCLIAVATAPSIVLTATAGARPPVGRGLYGPVAARSASGPAAHAASGPATVPLAPAHRPPALVHRIVVELARALASFSPD